MTNRSDRTAPQAALPSEAERRERHEALAGLLAAYVDGELPAETMAQIEAHLLGCDRCQREVSLHRAVVTTLGQTQGPVASAAFQTRVRQAVAATPVPPPATRSAETLPWWQQRAAQVGMMGVVVLMLGWWYVAPTPRRSSAATSPVVRGASATAVVVTGEPLFDSLRVHYEATAVRDLPGRARDLETVRRAVGMPIAPLAVPGAQLSGAWTSTLDGELIGVLAYRWKDKLLVQYVIPDAVIFRSAVVRNALAQQRLVAAQWGALGLLGWPQARGMTVLAAPTTWAELRSLHHVGG
jgi:anti-sigma factor RsiW